METRSSHYGGAGVSVYTMILIYIIFLISNAYSREISKNIQDDSEVLNVTTLYPVENITFHVTKDNKQNDKSTFEAEYDKIQQALENKVISTLHHEKCEKSNEIFDVKERHNDRIEINNNNEPEGQNFKNNPQIKSLKVNMTAWNINSAYSSSKIDENEGTKNMNNSNSTTKVKNEEEIKTFKASPHLGSFYDEDSFVIPTEATKLPFFPVDRPSSFISSPPDFDQLQYKFPIDYPTYKPIDAPYKYENTPNNNWVFQTGLEQRPTMEAPVKIPAGTLYAKPDVFREKPSSDGEDDNFGLEFKDEKENSVKKRGNPWQNLLNFVTALIPVGIIISALTPSIVTLESTDNNPYFPSRLSRRSEESLSDLPPISERCKRRLLCELHSDANYVRNKNTHQRQKKHCYKILCEDPQALSKVLRWLLFRNSHSPQPNLQDRRGYIT